MNCNVNAIGGPVSLRPPQRRSLEILDRITEIAPPIKDANIQAALDAQKRVPERDRFRTRVLLVVLCARYRCTE
jgi:hypothetical protein